MTRFSAYLSPTEGTPRLKLVGEFDLSVRELADEALEKAADSPELVLDLSELEFIDSTGVQFVIVANEQARERGCQFSIVKGGQAIERVFEALGLSRALPFVEAPPLTAPA